MLRGTYNCWTHNSKEEGLLGEQISLDLLKHIHIVTLIHVNVSANLKF